MTTQIQAEAHARNPGMPLELDWINDIQVNLSAVERRAATLPLRRSVKKKWQAAWLLRAVSCIDLTTLSGDDTPGKVERLCAKALQPVRQDILTGYGMADAGLTTAAVCIYHEMVATAVAALGGKVPVAAVSTGFPTGLNPFAQRVEEIKASVAAGADEIDIVITRQHVLRGDWEAIYQEVAAYREACGAKHIKTILGTGDLSTLKNVAKASMVCMMAGADFIKTSTGKESINATLPVGLTMVRQIREFYHQTGYKIGFKPAGGIRSAKETLGWLAMMKDELGVEWTKPQLFRFGASSLLADIERQLEHNLSGRYSAGYRHPMA